MLPMPQPVEPVPARGSARHTGSASGPTATRHWRPAIGGPRQRAQKGATTGHRAWRASPRERPGKRSAASTRDIRTLRLGRLPHGIGKPGAGGGPRQRAQEGPRRATGCVAGECERPGRASELRRAHGGPLAAWRASANGRAAPASSGGSTAGHWPRVAGEPMRTVCEGRAVQLRNACSLGRADQHRSHIEHGLSGTWLGAVNRARRESTCDAGGVQPRGRGHGEQLAQRGCQSLQGIEAIVTPSHTEAPRLLRQVGVVHEQRMNHDSSRSAS
jgi:hypothetical protein